MVGASAPLILRHTGERLLDVASAAAPRGLTILSTRCSSAHSSYPFSTGDYPSVRGPRALGEFRQVS